MKCRTTKKRNKKGFSLIEVIIGISIITLIITAAAEVTQTSIKMGSITAHELIAHHLAEEGLEVVRNTRDTNWMRNEGWKKGLDDGVTYLIIDNDQPRDFNGQMTEPPWKLIKKDGPEMPPDLANQMYRREITISYAPLTVNASTPADPTAEQTEVMNVTSTVLYTDRNKEKNMTLKTQLTDWKQGPL